MCQIEKYTRRVCEFCGKEFDSSGLGRPRLYCSGDCRNAAKYLSVFVNTINRIDFSSAAGKMLRGELFAISKSIKSFRTVEDSND